MSPFLDEEAEAVKYIPPAPVEVEEAVNQVPPAHQDVPMPAQAGLDQPGGLVVPPPPMAVTSGLVTPVQMDEAAPVTPTDREEPSLKKARICMVAGVEYEHEDDNNFTTFLTANLTSLKSLSLVLLQTMLKKEFL